MMNLIILGLLVLFELFTIIFVFDNITFDINKSYYNLKNNTKLFIEFLLLIGVVYYTSSNLVNNILILVYLLVSVILWLLISFLLPLYDFKTNLNLFKKSTQPTLTTNLYYNNLVNDDEQLNNNLNKNTRLQIFKKYLKQNVRNMSFENLYDNYNKRDEDYIMKQYRDQMKNQKKETNEQEKEKDYSMYNGYDKNHICYNCGCIKRDNGYIFCGKYIPNFGTIGCSPRWNCRNCKKCKEGYNNTSNKKYECRNCKCIKTDKGTICGKRGRIDGNIHKCDNSCTKCKDCQNQNDNSTNSNRIKKPKTYKYVKPAINLKNVIVNNISNINMEKVLR